MNRGFERTDLSLLAARLATADNSGPWMALLVGAELEAEEAADALSEAVHEISGVEVQRVHMAADAGDLVRGVRGAAGSLLVVTGLEALSPEEWRRLDLLRSALRREAGTVLIASHRTFERLAQHAPNLTGWFRAVHEWDRDAGQLTEEERKERIAALERWSGLSSAEVVAQATRGELSPEPEYREWLVLLDRGDLLAS